MFEQLKRKRMMIEESVTGKRSERDHMPSAERRRVIQNDLKQHNQMIKTMQNFRKTQNLSSQTTPNKTYQQEASIPINLQSSSEMAKPLMQSPTVRDINPSLDQQSLAKQFYQLSIDQKNQSIPLSPSPSPSPHNNLNLIDFYKKQPQANAQPPITLNNMEQNESHRQSEPHIEDEQIKFPKLINSSKTQSNNNSQAIFFTSQFKQFLNNQPNSANKISPIKQEIPKQPSPPTQNKQPKQQQPSLANNASGQSLAISNDSSLKYSLNESAIHDIINKKLSNQLVVQSIAQPESKSIHYFALGITLRENIADFIQFGKMVQLSKFIRKRELIHAMDRLMVNKQYKYQLRKEEIQIQQLQLQRKQMLVSVCFQEWWRVSRAKRDSIDNLILRKQRELKQKSFKTFKMLLFDRRINNQINLYYLSKIFLAMKTVTQKQSKKDNKKAYGFYIKNLKKRMLNLLIEGCYNSRRQNQINQSAYNHYYYSILRKYFQSWRNITPKEQKFIRVAMTTKNMLKETSDRRLLQTKTFDFYQVK